MGEQAQDKNTVPLPLGGFASYERSELEAKGEGVTRSEKQGEGVAPRPYSSLTTSAFRFKHRVGSPGTSYVSASQSARMP